MARIPLDEFIDALPIPIKARKVLFAAGVKTIGQLTDCKVEDFEKMRGVGPDMLRRIEEVLWDHGLKIHDVSRQRAALRQKRGKMRRYLSPAERRPVGAQAGAGLSRRITPRMVDQLVFHGALNSRDRYDATKVEVALIKLASLFLDAPRPWFSDLPDKPVVYPQNGYAAH
jgi:hypothetical protein